MSKEEFMKIQKCTLKVRMYCEGCKQKVKRILRKIDGVFIVEIDSKQGKVTVSGIVGPEVLINKLAKSNKHAELWGGGPEVNKNNGNINQNQLANQMKNIQIVNDEGDGNNKGQNQKCGNGINQPQSDGGGGGDVGGGQQGPKLQQPLQHLQPLQQMEVQDLKPTPQLKDAKMPPTNQNPNIKNVTKFNFPNEDNDMFDDELDDVDDEDFDDESDDEIVDHGHVTNNMKMSPMSNGNQMKMSGMMNPQMMNAQMMNQQMMNVGPMGGNMSIPTRGLMSNMSLPTFQMGNLPSAQDLPVVAVASGSGGGGGGRGGYFQDGSGGNVGGGYFQGVGLKMMVGNAYKQQQYMGAMRDQQKASMGIGNERLQQPMKYDGHSFQMNCMYPPYHNYPYPPHLDPTPESYNHFNDENTSSCNVM